MESIDRLIGGNCFRSNSIDRMQQEIARRYCEHNLQVLKSDTNLTGKFYRKPLQRMSINYLSYGAEVAIDAGDFENFYMLEFPISGRVDLVVGDSEYSTHSGCGTLISPGEYVKSVWSADCAQLMLQIDKKSLRNYLQKVVMRDVDDDLVFDSRIRFDCGPGASMYSYTKFLLEQSIANESLFQSQLVRSEFEDTIFAVLLEKFPHNYSADLKPGYGIGLPKHVSRAYRYIKSHAAESISNADLAALSGVSVRTLHNGFNKFLGMSPQACLRAFRLDRVKSELESAPGKVHVSQVARKWGFTHMGRFSQEFRRRFNIRPSQVLRR